MAANLLGELTAGLPENIRLKVRECLDRTRIQNPNDPVYELMIVLGTWAQYYQSIPASVKAAGESVGAQNRGMLESLDKRLDLLHTLAQAIQAAVDQLDGAPKAIVDQFPAEMMARSIAAQIDDKLLRKLPVTKLDADLRSLAAAMEKVTGAPGQKGLAERLDTGLTSLNESAGRLEKRGFVPDRWPRDVGFAVLGGLLVCGVMWLFAVKPLQDNAVDMGQLRQLLWQEYFVSQRVSAGVNEDNKPWMIIKGYRIDTATRDKNTEDITVVFKQ